MKKKKMAATNSIRLYFEVYNTKYFVCASFMVRLEIQQVTQNRVLRQEDTWWWGSEIGGRKRESDTRVTP